MDIEIKTTKAQEIATPKTKTMYWVSSWYNGVLMASAPWESKDAAEKCAYQIALSNKHVCIYKFEIDIPNFND